MLKSLYICQICSESFDGIDEFEEHERGHLGEHLLANIDKDELARLMQETLLTPLPWMIDRTLDAGPHDNQASK